MSTRNLLLAIVLAACLQIAIGQDAPIIQLPNGQIRGSILTTYHNVEYFNFQKIPFAKPPVGDLRFKAPVPADNWDGILETTNLDVMCYQTGQETPQESEDCLFLNVFTPQLPSDGNNPSLPVLVFVYGGGFVYGYAFKDAYSPEFIVENDVIVVTMNYRLGPLGFLATEDDVIPGNNGLKDMLLAIQWTHDNIQLFGGDPNRITIYGQSAGSIGVAYQLLNLKSEGLIAGAILQSGSYLMPAAFQRNPREIAFATAAFLNSTFETNRDSQELLNYLRTVPPNELDNAATRYGYAETTENHQIYQGIFWAPCIEPESDHAIVTEKMYVQLKEGRVIQVPVLMGHVSEEELGDLGNVDSTTRLMDDFDTHLDWLPQNDMRLTTDDDKLRIGSEIRDIYTGGGRLVDDLGAGVRLMSDACYNRGIRKHAELTSNFARVYFYQFSYDSDKNGGPYEGTGGVGHAEDLWYLWTTGGNWNWPGLPDDFANTVQRMVKFYTDFVKYQNPTPEPSDIMQNIIWPTVNSGGEGNFLYVDIDDNLEIRNQPKGETYSKWVEIYDSLGYDDFDSY